MTVEVAIDVTRAEGRPEALTATLRFTNVGDTAVSFLPIQLDSPSLALQILDADDRPVLLPPPPVPDPSAERVELAPGESAETAYAGLLPGHSEPGRYRVRARLVGAVGPAGSEAAESDWVELTVTP